MVLAQCQAEDGQVVGTQFIAERSQVPPTYLSKILQALNRAQLVHAKKGVGGGFRLRRPAAEISVLDVVNAISPIRRVKTCPLKLESHCQRLCPMHARLDEAMAHVEEALAQSSVADLLHDPTRPRPMLETVSGSLA